MGKCYLYGGGAAGLIRLIVRAATGSTVTCTKDDAVITAAEQDGRWTVDLQPGTWTVEVEKDGVTKSYTVELQYSELIVGYELTLYDLGDITDATGGWERKTFGGNDLTESSYNGVVNIRGQTGSSGAYLAANAIDLSGYKKLIYTCGIGGNGAVKVAIMPIGATSADDAVASKEVTTFTTTPTVQEEMDISELSGRYQVGLTLTSAGGIINAYMAFIKLE